MIGSATMNSLTLSQKLLAISGNDALASDQEKKVSWTRSQPGDDTAAATATPSTTTVDADASAALRRLHLRMSRSRASCLSLLIHFPAVTVFTVRSGSAEGRNARDLAQPPLFELVQRA